MDAHDARRRGQSRRPGGRSTATGSGTTRAGPRPAVSALAQGNDYVGVAVATTVSTPATAWWAPVETISNSESGFERVYQGSGLLLSWPLALRAGGTFTVRVHHAVTTAVDRAAEEASTRAGASARPVRRGRLVVHGHFYQPSRVDPFSGTIPADPSAAPAHDWTARVSAECYRPNAEIGNLGAHLVGSRADPRRLAGAARRAGVSGFVEGDAGANGLAQPFHHTILPLAAAHDRLTEIRWGLRDFELRFGRPAARDVAAGDGGRPADAAG